MSYEINGNFQNNTSHHTQSGESRNSALDFSRLTTIRVGKTEKNLYKLIPEKFRHALQLHISRAKISPTNIDKIQTLTTLDAATINAISVHTIKQIIFSFKSDTLNYITLHPNDRDDFISLLSSNYHHLYKFGLNSSNVKLDQLERITYYAAERINKHFKEQGMVDPNQEGVIHVNYVVYKAIEQANKKAEEVKKKILALVSNDEGNAFNCSNPMNQISASLGDEQHTMLEQLDETQDANVKANSSTLTHEELNELFDEQHFQPTIPSAEITLYNEVLFKHEPGNKLWSLDSYEADDDLEQWLNLSTSSKTQGNAEHMSLPSPNTYNFEAADDEYFNM